MKYNIEPLIQARQEKRLTLTELAARIGVTEDMVRKIEKGVRRPSEKTVMRMSSVLDVPMAELIGKRKRSA